MDGNPEVGWIQNCPCNLGRPIQICPCILGRPIQIPPCILGRPIQIRPYILGRPIQNFCPKFYSQLYSQFHFQVYFCFLLPVLIPTKLPTCHTTMNINWNPRNHPKLLSQKSWHLVIRNGPIARGFWNLNQSIEQKGKNLQLEKCRYIKYIEITF